MIKNQRITKQ